MTDAAGMVCPQCRFQNTVARDRCARCGAVITDEGRQRQRKFLLVLLVLMLVPTAVVLLYPLIVDESAVAPPPGAAGGPDAAARIAAALERARAAEAKSDWTTVKAAAGEILAIDASHPEAKGLLSKAQSAQPSPPPAAQGGVDEKELKKQLYAADQAGKWADLQALAQRGLEVSPDDTVYMHYFKRGRGHLTLERARKAFEEARIDQAQDLVELARKDNVSDSILDQDLELHELYVKARNLLDRGDLGAAHDLLLDYRLSAGEIGRLATFVNAIHVAREEIARGNYARALLFFDDARRRLPKSPYVSETLSLLRRGHPWLVPELIFESSGQANFGLPLQATITPGGTDIIFLERESERYAMALVHRVTRDFAWTAPVNLPLFPHDLILACSPNGRRVVLGSAEGSIGVYDVKTGDQLSTFRLDGLQSNAVFGVDSRTLYVSDGVGAIRIVDTESGMVTGSYAPGDVRFVEVDVSPDGEHLLATEMRGEVFLWKTDRLDRTTSTIRATEVRRSARFTSDSRSVVFIEGNKTIRLRGIGTLQDVKISEGDYIEANLITAPGIVALWRKRDGHVDVFNLRNAERLSYFNTGYRLTDRLMTSADGAYLLGLGTVEGTAHPTIRVWSVGR